MCAPSNGWACYSQGQDALQLPQLSGQDVTVWSDQGSIQPSEAEGITMPRGLEPLPRACLPGAASTARTTKPSVSRRPRRL